MPTYIQLVQTSEQLEPGFAVSRAIPLNGGGLANFYPQTGGGATGVKMIDSTTYSDLTSIAGGSTAFVGHPPYVNDEPNTPDILCIRSDVHDICRVDLTDGSSSTIVDATTLGPNIYAAADYVSSPYGFFLRLATGPTRTQLYRWSHTGPVPATPSLLVDGIGIEGGQIVFDQWDENQIYINGIVGTGGEGVGNPGVIRCFDYTGTQLWEAEVTDEAWPGGIAPHPRGGVIVLCETVFDTGVMRWLHVHDTGTVEDITANVTVNGSLWTSFPGLAEVEFGSPGIDLGFAFFGNWIGWGEVSFLYGGTAHDGYGFYGPVIVTEDEAINLGWSVGSVRWGTLAVCVTASTSEETVAPGGDVGEVSILFDIVSGLPAWAIAVGDTFELDGDALDGFNLIIQIAGLATSTAATDITVTIEDPGLFATQSQSTGTPGTDVPFDVTFNFSGFFPATTYTVTIELSDPTAAGATLDPGVTLEMCLEEPA